MNKWRQLGGQAGIGLAVLGFVLIFLGWNGAATYDREPAQLPYVISGGLAGLAVVVVGAALMIISAQRQDRAATLDALAEVRDAIDRLALAGAAGGRSGNGAAGDAAAEGMVIAGPTTYHLPTCRLLDGRGALPAVSLDAAIERGLTPCRACDAADLSLPVAEREEPTAGSRRRRSTRSAG